MRSLIVLLLVFSISTSFCQKKEVPENPISAAEITKIVMKFKDIPPQPVEEDDIAVIETNMGIIKLKFFPELAHDHCANFKRLANNGFYNGITFHRVLPDFMIQTGDILTRDDNPGNDGTGSPGFALKAEFSLKSHKRGIVSAARLGNNIDSGSSQFFICVVDSPYLDGQYSVFGEVIEGMDVADKIANTIRDSNDRPIRDVIMEDVKVVKRK